MLLAEQDQATQHWYQKATVRYTPRIMVPEYNAEDLIYPLAHCAVCDHPAVLALGPAARSYILAQAAYRFLYGVGLLETKFVIQCSLDLLHNRLPGIDEFAKLQALTVVIDEGYHAHVALDYICQMQQRSGIKPLMIPQSNRKLDAYARACVDLAPELHPDFQLLAVTLAENILTDEIATMGRDKGLASSFTTLMMDHVKDEGRHSGYFADLMRQRWSCLSQTVQLQLGAMLPDYLDDFLGYDSTRAFDRRLLQAVELDAAAIELVLDQTEADFIASAERLAHKTKPRLHRLLKQIGVLDLEANQLAFSQRGYAAPRS